MLPATLHYSALKPQIVFGNTPQNASLGSGATANPPLSVADKINAAIKVVPNFPKPGIPFKDIMPVLRDSQLLSEMMEHFYQQVKGLGIKYVAGIESRGIMLGAPLALKLGAGFIPIRKAGKLPGDVEREQYALEYGTDTIEIQKDALQPGDNVLLIDDVLATGGTAVAAVSLLDKLKANIKSILFLIELDALKGRQKLAQHNVHAMIHA